MGFQHLSRTAGVTVQVVSDENELVRLRPEWQRILLADQHATVYQSWEWAFGNWSFRSVGKRLYVLAVWDSTSELRGIAPLWMREVWLGTPLRIVEFVGTGGTDYLDFAAEPGWLEPTIAACLAHLFGDGVWNVLNLREIRQSSPTAAYLRADSSFRKAQGTIEQLQHVCADSAAVEVGRLSRVAWRKHEEGRKLGRESTAENFHGRVSCHRLPRPGVRRRNRNGAAPPPSSSS